MSEAKILSIALEGHQIVIRNAGEKIVSDLETLAQYIALYESTENNATIPMVLVFWQEVLKCVQDLDPASSIAYGQIQGYLTNARGAQDAVRHEAMHL